MKSSVQSIFTCFLVILVLGSIQKIAAQNPSDFPASPKDQSGFPSLTINIDLEILEGETDIENKLDQQLELSLKDLDLTAAFKAEIKDHFKSLYLNAIREESLITDGHLQENSVYTYVQEMTFGEMMYNEDLLGFQYNIPETFSFNTTNDALWPDKNRIQRLFNPKPLFETLESGTPEEPQISPANNLDRSLFESNQKIYKTKAGYKLNKHFSLESDYIQYLMHPAENMILNGIQPFNSGSIVGVFMRF